MITSAALLIRERGARATAVGDVLAHSGAPRGSAYHYFPGGRNELISGAVDYAADYVAHAIAGSRSGTEMLDTAVGFYRQGLLSTDYRAGCPVLAVAVEAGDPNVAGEVIARAASAFTRWQSLIAQRLVDDGVAADLAAELAALVIAALEGALALARASRDVGPLDAVHHQLRTVLENQTTKEG